MTAKNKNIKEELDNLTIKYAMLENVVIDLKEKIEVLTSTNKGRNDSNDKTKEDLEQVEESNSMRKGMEIKCNLCDKTFDRNVDLENHLKEHKEAETYSCNMCGKTFHLQWRLKRHTEVHSTLIHCHYFNNRKHCPFSDIGCKFKHEHSKICRYNSACEKTLCQFKHNNESNEMVIEDVNDTIEAVSKQENKDDATSEIQQLNLELMNSRKIIEDLNKTIIDQQGLLDIAEDTVTLITESKEVVEDKLKKYLAIVRKMRNQGQI